MKVIKKPWFIPIILGALILAIGGFYIKGMVTNAETLPEEEIRKQLEEAYGGKVAGLTLKGTIYEAEMVRNKDEYFAEVDAETGKVLSLIQTKEVIEEDLPIVAVEKGETQDDSEKSDSSEQENVQKEEEKSEPEKVSEEPAKPKPTPTPTPPKKTEVKPTPTKKTEVKPTPTKPQKNNTGKENQTSPSKKPATVLITEKQAIQIALGQLKGEVDNVDFEETSDGGYYLVEIEDENDDEATFQIHAISGKILSVTWDD